MHAEREARSVQRVSVRLRGFTVCTYVYSVYSISTVFTVYTLYVLYIYIYIVYTVFTVFTVYIIVYTVFSVFTKYRISEFVSRGARSAERATNKRLIIRIYCL